MGRCKWCNRKFKHKGCILVKDGKLFHPPDGLPSGGYCSTCADALRIKYGIHKHKFESKTIQDHIKRQVFKERKCMICGFEIETKPRSMIL